MILRTNRNSWKFRLVNIEDSLKKKKKKISEEKKNFFFL